MGRGTKCFREQHHGAIRALFIQTNRHAASGWQRDREAGLDVGNPRISHRVDPKTGAAFIRRADQFAAHDLEALGIAGIILVFVIVEISVDGSEHASSIRRKRFQLIGHEAHAQLLVRPKRGFESQVGPASLDFHDMN